MTQSKSGEESKCPAAFERSAEIKRETKETKIHLTLNLDGQGETMISTGVGFLNHMLELLGKHALFDLNIEASGDTEIDYHHTVEDVGICLGQAIKQALGDKTGICRFGDATVPMDEALANVAIDLSGRAAFIFNVDFPSEKIGDYDSALTAEFLNALASNAGMNLHINVPYGKNAHHISEAIFKGTAKALDKATRIDERAKGSLPSTKGSL